MSISYPAHLSDKARIKITSSLILHEFKKLFKTLPKSGIEQIAEDIDGWWLYPEEYNLKAIRDFWNGADGVMNGFKLKNIIPLITSQNIKWSMTPEVIEIKDLRFTADLANLKLNKERAEDVTMLLDSKSSELAIYKKKSEESFSFGLPREDDPIIVVQEDSDQVYVHDGNGRLFKAILDRKKSLKAYIGIRDSTLSQNYWVPTNQLIQLVDYYKNNVIDFDILTASLLKIFKESKSAIYEFQDRVDLEEILKEKIVEKYEKTTI